MTIWVFNSGNCIAVYVSEFRNLIHFPRRRQRIESTGKGHLLVATGRHTKNSRFLRRCWSAQFDNQIDFLFNQDFALMDDWKHQFIHMEVMLWRWFARSRFPGELKQLVAFVSGFRSNIYTRGIILSILDFCKLRLILSRTGWSTMGRTRRKTLPRGPGMCAFNISV